MSASSTEITVQDRRSAAIEHSEDADVSSPLMALIERMAANPDLDAEKCARLVKIFTDGQRDMRRMQDEALFKLGMAAFKKNPPQIIKTRIAKMKSKDGSMTFDIPFADLEMVTAAIAEGLAEVGITHGFRPKQEGERVTVTCVLSLGLYGEETTLSGPIDTTGAKNPIQSIGSTLSYLERYTLMAATGMAAGMPDSDGNKPKQTGPGMDPQAAQDWVDALNNAPTLESLKAVFGECWAKSKALKDMGAKKRFETIYEALKKEFNEGAR